MYRQNAKPEPTDLDKMREMLAKSVNKKDIKEYSFPSGSGQNFTQLCVEGCRHGSGVMTTVMTFDGNGEMMSFRVDCL